jgi:hypothetical protein
LWRRNEDPALKNTVMKRLEKRRRIAKLACWCASFGLVTPAFRPEKPFK